MDSTTLALCTGLYLALSTTLAGLATSGYSAIRQTLSELGAQQAAHARLVNCGIFLPVGLACAWLATQHPLATPAGLLAISLAAGYLGAATWPLGPPGQLRHKLHLLCGGLEYLGGIAALLLLAAHGGIVPIAIAGTALVAFIGLLLPSFRSISGFWQRILEATLFATLAMTV